MGPGYTCSPGPMSNQVPFRQTSQMTFLGLAIDSNFDAWQQIIVSVKQTPYTWPVNPQIMVKVKMTSHWVRC